ncbi:hypothetical protein HYQ46_009161 [Verticillium longisporum]|nr:hypothetical protein HYQ46_009161 [Verticillium longisporum]
MQYSLASLAVLALATSAAAQEFITFTRASQSTRDFGVLRRQSNGYQPEDEVCAGEGSTCAEACGTGYLQCSSSDSSVHCYNPAANESCCSTGTGSSCLGNFYCTHDTQVETWCCPNGLSLKECAVKFGVTGALTSDLPKATSTSSAYKLPSTTTTTTTSSSTSSTSSSSTSSTSSVVVETTSAPVIESSTVASINSTSYAPVTSSVVPTSSSSLIAAANTTSTRCSSTFHSAAPTVLKTSAAAVPSPSQVNQDSAATSSVVVETTSAPVIESSTVASINSTTYAPVTSSLVPTSSSTFIAAANTTSTRASSTFHSAAPTVLETTAAAVPSPSQVHQDSAALANGPASLALVASMAFLFALF